MAVIKPKLKIGGVYRIKGDVSDSKHRYHIVKRVSEDSIVSHQYKGVCEKCQTEQLFNEYGESDNRYHKNLIVPTEFNKATLVGMCCTWGNRANTRLITDYIKRRDCVFYGDTSLDLCAENLIFTRDPSLPHSEWETLAQLNNKGV